MSSNKNWSLKWPTKSGQYWFYGSRFGDDENKFWFVDVWMTGNGLPVYVMAGNFMYKSEGHSGVWQEIEFPAKPESV